MESSILNLLPLKTLSQLCFMVLRLSSDIWTAYRSDFVRYFQYQRLIAIVKAQVGLLVGHSALWEQEAQGKAFFTQ